MKKNLLIISGIVLVVLVVIILFQANNQKYGSQTSNLSENTVIINLDASKYNYSLSNITVKKGSHVKIIVNNLDVPHGLAIPALNVSGMDSLEFDATTPGIYQFKCPTMCGSGHRSMTGTLIIEE